MEIPAKMPRGLPEGGDGGGERRKSQPVIGRRTLVRVSGFAGLAVTLSVGLVWVDRRYSAPSSGLEPVRAPARTINDARSTVDPGASRPRPARLDLAAVGLGTVLALAPEVLVASAASAPRLSVVRSGVGADVVNRELVGQSARAPHSGRMSQAGGPAIGSVMSGFMKTTRLGSSISRLGVRAGGPTVAGPSYPEPRGTGPLKCGTWKGGFWPATSSAVSRGRPRESPVTRTIPFNPPTRRCGGVRVQRRYLDEVCGQALMCLRRSLSMRSSYIEGHVQVTQYFVCLIS